MHLHRLLALSTLALTVALLPVIARAAGSPAVAPLPEKTRIIVLTDIGGGEPDDEQSLVRLMVYSNHFDIEGLIANTSAWQPNRVHPELIRAIVEAYGKARDNLLVHAPGFPTAESVLAAIRTGRAAVGMTGVGDGLSTDASELILAAVDRPDPRPVWVLAWGGATDLAQALWDVKRRRSPEEAQRFAAKLRVYDIAGQDDTGAWITHTFPDIKWLRSQVQFFGMSRRFDGTKRYIEARGGDETVMNREWIHTHIQTHGPLGASYKHATYKYEGDTPSILHLLPTGLGDPEQPHHGSWGGRFTAERQKNPGAPAIPRVTTEHKYYDYWMHIDAADTWSFGGATYRNEFAPLFRWREAFQHDFAARMDWMITPQFSDANHGPVAALNGDASRNVVYRSVRSGEALRLSAAASFDPDRDKLAYEWWHYPEPGTFSGEIKFSDNSAAEVAITMPDVTKPQTAHVVLTVRDNGQPALFSYKRLVLTISPRAS